MVLFEVNPSLYVPRFPLLLSVTVKLTKHNLTPTKYFDKVLYTFNIFNFGPSHSLLMMI